MPFAMSRNMRRLGKRAGRGAQMNLPGAMQRNPMGVARMGAPTAPGMQQRVNPFGGPQLAAGRTPLGPQRATPRPGLV